MNRIRQGKVTDDNFGIGYWLSHIGHSPKVLGIGQPPMPVRRPHNFIYCPRAEKVLLYAG